MEYLDWLNDHLRAVVALGMTALLITLALQGHEASQTALVAAFSVLMGAMWGERAALKIPGTDT